MVLDVVSTPAGRAAVERLMDAPAKVVLAVDFDGVLAPIVADPAMAAAHPDAARTLGRLAPRLGAVAVVTGRPVQQVLELGGFVRAPGLDRLRVLGQYGIERWDASTGETQAPPPPPGIATARERVGALLADLGLADAFVEDKGRALGLHVRRMADPDAALAKLRAPVNLLAGELDLHVEPGKHVLELRAAGADKGDAIDALLAECPEVDTVVYAGDDLGDAAAYDAVDRHRAAGGHGLLIWSASADAAQQTERLSSRADLVLDGPDGVVGWLGWLADQLEAAR